MQGDTQIGQKIHWKVVTSAIGPPGQKVQSMINMGEGYGESLRLQNSHVTLVSLKERGLDYFV